MSHQKELYNVTNHRVEEIKFLQSLFTQAMNKKTSFVG